MVGIFRPTRPGHQRATKRAEYNPTMAKNFRPAPGFSGPQRGIVIDAKDGEEDAKEQAKERYRMAMEDMKFAVITHSRNSHAVPASYPLWQRCFHHRQSYIDPRRQPLPAHFQTCLFRIMLLRRLSLPFPLALRTTLRCGSSLGTFGDNRATCTQSVGGIDAWGMRNEGKDGLWGRVK